MRLERELTDKSKPISRASALTSSRSSSIDGSLVLLFSKCHNRGPKRIQTRHGPVPSSNDGGVLT